MTSKKTEDTSAKKSKSKGSRSSNARKPEGTPRLLIGALIVILVGAAILFWPRGGSIPTGIGEMQSVVITTPDSNAIASGSMETKPHSSNVDINSESLEIVPESPDGSGLSSDEAAAQDKKIAAVAQKTVAAKTAKTSETKPKSKPKSIPEDNIIPQKNGSWAVQVGAYGDATNADKEALRLQAKGWDARVRAGNNSNGTMVFRVWIGYFTSRSVAEKFARQNSRDIPNAIAVHR